MAVMTVRSWLMRRRSTLGLLLLSGMCSVAVARPAPAADTIYISAGPIEIPVSVEALGSFADTGQVSPELMSTVGRLDQSSQERLRQRLTKPLAVDPFSFSQLAYSYLGDDFLQRLGAIVRTGAHQNGFLASRAAMIMAAQDPQGMTLIGIIRHFPTDIRISAGDILYLERQFQAFGEYKAAALQAIQQQSQQEIAAMGPIDFAQRRDLRQPGPFTVRQQTLTLVDPNRTSPYSDTERRFDVDLYLPQISQAAPVVVISHGWGGNKRDFAFLGQHLASYGFAVAIPQHVGSDYIFQQRFLAGMFYDEMSPQEYIDRPQDISYTLDQLEQMDRPGAPLAGRLDLDRVGMIGHSLGGYTALAVAGAPLNYGLLEQGCSPDRPPVFNLSYYLQCRAAQLPPGPSNFGDPRVDAVMALNPVTSLVQGPTGMADIKIPVLLETGTVDMLAPAIQEQIHPFTWLTTDQKYLMVMDPAAHSSIIQTQIQDHDPYAGVGPNTPLGSIYARAIATAFMQVYVAGDPGYRPYLSAAYAAYLSTEPMALTLVQSLTADQLETAYGGPSPFPIRPGTPAAATGSKMTVHP